MMRPNVEACNDNPNHGLKAEVSELKNSISHLKAQLATSGQFLIGDPDFFHLGSSPVGDGDLWCHLRKESSPYFFNIVTFPSSEYFPAASQALPDAF